MGFTVGFRVLGFRVEGLGFRRSGLLRLRGC